MLDGSDSGEINALAITKEGEHFVSGGEDKKIKVWDYDEGISYYSGVGHSGHITRVNTFLLLTSFRLPCHQIKSILLVWELKEPFSAGTLPRRSTEQELTKNYQH